MPHDKLQELMLSRPGQVTGEVQYPKQGDPGVVDDKFMRALGVALGIQEQAPGDAAGAIGGTAGLATAIINPKVARLLGKLLVGKLKVNGLPTPIPKLQGEVLGLQDRVIGKPLPAETMNALEMAQKRWPRLFGHIDDITYLSPDMAARPGISGAAKASRQLNRQTKNGPQIIGRTSKIELGPERIRKGDAANTVGHELLHVKDFLTKPDMPALNALSSSLPGGYPVKANEVRARLQGARTKAYGMGFGRKDIEPYATVEEDWLGRYPNEGFDIVKKVDSRISNLPPDDLPINKPAQEPNDKKITRLIYERMDRKNKGLPKDPRVPKPKKD